MSKQPMSKQHQPKGGTWHPALWVGSFPLVLLALLVAQIRVKTSSSGDFAPAGPRSFLDLQNASCVPARHRGMFSQWCTRLEIGGGTPPAYASQLDCAALRRVSNNNSIILTSANCGFLPLALNMWAAWQRLGISNVVFVAEDAIAAAVLSQHVGADRVIASNTASAATQALGAQPFGSAGYGELVQRRPHHVYALLDAGFSVLWMDADSVPLIDFMPLLPNGYDAVLMNDAGAQQRQKPSLCTCFMLLQPTPGSHAILEAWCAELADSSTVVVDGRPLSINQVQFNKALLQVADNASTFVMPSALFPNGAEWDHHKGTAAWCHANYLEGAEHKMEFLAARGLWMQGYVCTDHWTCTGVG